jgi:hypothetical protein
MQLPCAWFEQIVEALDGTAPDGAGAAAPDRRRREPRVGVRAPVTLIPLTNDAGLGAAPVAVHVRDLSAGGIGFLHSTKISLDAQFVALLPHGAGDSVAVLCEVAYYQPMGEKVFSVGARFVRVLRQPAGEKADATLSMPAREAAPQRRAAS